MEAQMKLFKLAPKGIKICPGCPPRKTDPLVTPKFALGSPMKKVDDTKVESIKVQTIKKRNEPSSGALF